MLTKTGSDQRSTPGAGGNRFIREASFCSTHNLLLSLKWNLLFGSKCDFYLQWFGSVIEPGTSLSTIITCLTPFTHVPIGEQSSTSTSCSIQFQEGRPSPRHVLQRLLGSSRPDERHNLSMVFVLPTLCNIHAAIHSVTVSLLLPYVTSFFVWHPLVHKPKHHHPHLLYRWDRCLCWCGPLLFYTDTTYPWVLNPQITV